MLTSGVFASFAAFCAARGGPADAVEQALRGDAEARRLLVERESGRITESEFEHAFAPLLGRYGLAVEPAGLLAGLTAGLEPDEVTIAAVRALRARGVPVAIVSNALDSGSYDGYDLDALADVVVLSHDPDVAVRKPSRRIYALTAERLGVAPEECVLLDDLQQNLDGAARLGIAGILHRDAQATAAALETWFPAA